MTATKEVIQFPMVFGRHAPPQTAIKRPVAAATAAPPQQQEKKVPRPRPSRSWTMGQIEAPLRPPPLPLPPPPPPPPTADEVAAEKLAVRSAMPAAVARYAVMLGSRMAAKLGGPQRKEEP